jgi:hypothetical protein
MFPPSAIVVPMARSVRYLRQVDFYPICISAVNKSITRCSFQNDRGNADATPRGTIDCQARGMRFELWVL